MSGCEDFAVYYLLSNRTTCVMAESQADITVSHGIPTELRGRAAQLYDIAFGEKLALAIPNADDRVKLLS